MDAATKIQEEIIRTFVIPAKRERLLWELSAGKPPRETLLFTKFHTAALFVPRYVHPIKALPPSGLKRLLTEHGAADPVFFWGEACGEQMPLSQAVELTSLGGVQIIYCGNGLAYYQGEEGEGGKSSPPRCLLLRK